MDKMTPEIFFKGLIIEFSTLEISINEEELEHYHMKMEVFAEYTNRQIKMNNNIEVERCFKFLENRINSFTPDLENALKVSFIESLMLGENSSKMDEMKKIMTSKFKQKYIEYENWYNSLNEN